MTTAVVWGRVASRNSRTMRRTSAGGPVAGRLGGGGIHGAAPAVKQAGHRFAPVRPGQRLAVVGHVVLHGFQARPFRQGLHGFRQVVAADVPEDVGEQAGGLFHEAFVAVAEFAQLPGAPGAGAAEQADEPGAVPARHFGVPVQRLQALGQRQVEVVLYLGPRLGDGPAHELLHLHQGLGVVGGAGNAHHHGTTPSIFCWNSSNCSMWGV